MIKLKKLFENKFILLSSIYTLLYIVAGFWKYFEIALIPYLIFAYICLDVENDFYFFIFSQLLYVSRLFSRISIVSQAIYITILLIKFVIGVKNKKYNLHRNLLIMIAIFTGYGLVMSLFYKMAVYSISYLFYLPFFYMVFATRKEYDLKKIFRILSYSIIILSVVSLVTQISPHYNFDCLKHEGSQVRFKAFFGSANTLYMIAILAICGMSYLFFHKDIYLIEYLGCYLALGIITLLTLSKAGIGILGIITIINVVLYLSIDFKRTWWQVALLGVIGGLLLLIFKEKVMRLFERFFKEYDNSNIFNSLTTGRMDIWKDYLKAIFATPFSFLFGHGTLSKYVYCAAQGRDRAQHNLYIFLLYKFGLCGCILLGLVIREFIVAANKKAPKFINYLPLIYFLLLGMCDNAFMYTHFYILVSFVLFNTDEKTKIDN